MAAASQTAPETAAAKRKEIIDLLSRATLEELRKAWDELPGKPVYTVLKGPETGLVMVRGRIGGGGAPFNLGEATMTRATVRLASGTVGFAFALGTDRERASLAAVFEALAQEPASAALVNEGLCAPIAARIAAENRRKAEETAATRVDFFTMVRGED